MIPNPDPGKGRPNFVLAPERVDLADWAEGESPSAPARAPFASAEEALAAMGLPASVRWHPDRRRASFAVSVKSEIAGPRPETQCTVARPAGAILSGRPGAGVTPMPPAPRK